MEAKVQRTLIWAGPVMMAGWIGAFILIAGYIPPHHPGDSAQEIATLYKENSGSIKLGMVISMAASALLVPWAIAISGQLKRIDGARALATTQMVSCALLSLEFITPIGIWMATSFRADLQPAFVTQALNDVGWILFVTVIWSVWLQMIAIGWAILIDRREQPLLPRWVGYQCFWTALLITPAGLVLFFREGPFAWDGLVGFFIPLFAFTLWVVALTYYVHRALTVQIQEGTEPG